MPSNGAEYWIDPVIARNVKRLDDLCIKLLESRAVSDYNQYSFILGMIGGTIANIHKRNDEVEEFFAAQRGRAEREEPRSDERGGMGDAD